MKNFKNIEYNQFMNRLITDSFCDAFISFDVYKIKSLLHSDGKFFNMDKDAFIMYLKELFCDESYQIINHQVNYSLNYSPSELVQTFTLRLYNSELVLLNFLLQFKDDMIFKILNEKKFINETMFKYQQFYN